MVEGGAVGEKEADMEAPADICSNMLQPGRPEFTALTVLAHSSLVLARYFGIVASEIG